MLALAPAAMISRRFTQKARGIFIREINAGGLVLLNEASHAHPTTPLTFIARSFFFFRISMVFVLLIFRAALFVLLSFLVLLCFFLFSFLFSCILVKDYQPGPT